jgi:hypothetical protein
VKNSLTQGSILNIIKFVFTKVTVFFFAFSVYSQGEDIVEGNLIQFNDNGFWCWYQDERAVIDVNNNK